MSYEIKNGDCLQLMHDISNSSIDSIVTDPPYGIDFIGSEWDHGIPGIPFWKEALRISKPGAHLLAFGGTRTYHRLACAIEDAGWEIRDCLMWVYSGFPKSHNISKSLKENEKQDDGVVSKWEGWGTCLKPAWEPIIMARKPFKESVAKNVLQHGVGGLNIDGCRIPVSADREDEDSQGRFPANFMHDGSDDVVSLFPQSESGNTKGNSYEDKTFLYKGGWKYIRNPDYGDKGSAARFFYCAKASKLDRGDFNDHPTVKPISLMRYLCRLVTPPSGMVVDPFMGSGSTGKAALLEGFSFKGIELSSQYFDIAERRIRETDEELKSSDIMRGK